MKESFLEKGELIKDSIKNESFITKENELNPKKQFNYKFWIIILSALDFISLLLLILFRVIEQNIFRLFVVFTIIFSFFLIVLMILKIKRDKKEKEENKNNIELEEIITQEEEKKLSEMKKKIIKNQKKIRETKKNSENMTEKKKNKKINEVLEDMCIYGTITKKEIKKEKKEHPEKFIETSKALNMENQDQELFALGLISQNLENLGIETAIEKNSNPNDQDDDITSLQFFTNGLVSKKKYDLHFEFGEERNEELLNNEKEFEKFKENLKKKLSKDYNIPPEKIIITLPQKGSFHVQVIFQSNDFHDLDKNQFIKKFKNDPDYEELSLLKDIHEDVIMGGVRLKRAQLDQRGNRNDGWGVGEQRGGKDYDPPLGFNGIGLRVLNKYDNGDNTWLGMDNVPGEWCVAYHGVAYRQSSDNVKSVTGKIVNTTFNAGYRQAHEDCPDQFHQGKKVGCGVYCTPKIKTAEEYAGESRIGSDIYKTVLMVRVKPNAIRHCNKCSTSRDDQYWVVNGTTDEIRPYRILYKKC